MGIVSLRGEAKGVVGGRRVATLAGRLSKVSVEKGQGVLELASADKVQAVLGRLKGGLGLAAWAGKDSKAGRSTVLYCTKGGGAGGGVGGEGGVTRRWGGGRGEVLLPVAVGNHEGLIVGATQRGRGLTGKGDVPSNQAIVGEGVKPREVVVSRA